MTYSRGGAPKLVHVGGLPGRAGRRLGAWQPAVHVGRAEPRPAGLRRHGRRGRGQRRTFPRRPHLRHLRPERPAPDRGGPDLPRVAHPYPGAGSAATPTCCTSTTRPHRACAKPTNWRICSDGEPDANPETALYSIDVIKVPLDAPETRRHRQPAAHLRRSARPVSIAGLWQGGTAGVSSQRTAQTNHCHDITVYPETEPGGGRMQRQRHPAGHLRSGESDAGIATSSIPTWPTGTRPPSTTPATRSSSPTNGAAAPAPAAGPRTRPTGAPIWSPPSKDRTLEGQSFHKLPGVQGRDRELRRPQRHHHPGARARPDGSGLVPGRDLDHGLHRRGHARSRSPISTAARSTPSVWSSAVHGRPTGSTAASIPARSRAVWTC